MMTIEEWNKAHQVAENAIQMIRENDDNLYNYLKRMNIQELAILTERFNYNFGHGCFYIEYKDIFKNIYTILINKLDKYTSDITNDYFENEEKFFNISYIIRIIYSYDRINLLKNELNEIYNMLYRLPYSFLGKIKKNNVYIEIIGDYRPNFIREVRKEKGLSIGEEAFQETTTLTNQTHKEILDYLWEEKTRMTYDEHYKRLLGIKDKEVLNRKYPKLERTLK